MTFLQVSCARVMSTTALVLHALIAYVEFFIMSNFASWLVAVLLVKNSFCIVGEGLALVVICKMEGTCCFALPPDLLPRAPMPPVPRPVAVPLPVASVIVQSQSGAGGAATPEAV